MTQGIKSRDTLETLIRVRRNGYVTTEFSIMDKAVQTRTYFPSGHIHETGNCSLDTFLDTAKRIRDERQ